MSLFISYLTSCDFCGNDIKKEVYLIDTYDTTPEIVLPKPHKPKTVGYSMACDHCAELALQGIDNGRK